MTIVSNDPVLWPLINSFRISSYFSVAASAAVMYDWAITLGKEVDLIWNQRWTLMTVLYLGIRYLGISYVIVSILLFVPTIPVTDVGCRVMYITLIWTGVAVNGMLGVVMTLRLYVLYEHARKLLICLVVILLGNNIAGGVVNGILTSRISSVEIILSGTYQCNTYFEGNDTQMATVTWTLGTAWEVLVLCLAVWVAVKRFRQLRHSPAGGVMGSLFTVLIKTHMVYFASFIGVSCFLLVYYSPKFATDSYSLGTYIYLGILQIFTVVQLFVLGPRLILGVRERHAKLKVEFNTATPMTLRRTHVSTTTTTTSSV